MLQILEEAKGEEEEAIGVSEGKELRVLREKYSSLRDKESASRKREGSSGGRSCHSE